MTYPLQRGRLTQSDRSSTFTETIAKNGKTQSFFRKGNMTWGFPDTFWWGKDHFKVCHHLEGKRAVVFCGREAITALPEN